MMVQFLPRGSAVDKLFAMLDELRARALQAELEGHLDDVDTYLHQYQQTRAALNRALSVDQPATGAGTSPQLVRAPGRTPVEFANERRHRARHVRRHRPTHDRAPSPHHARRCASGRRRRHRGRLDNRSARAPRAQRKL